MKQLKKRYKKIIYKNIKYDLYDYNYEREIINRISYCNYECCDGFLPIVLIDNVPFELLCHVITKTY